MSLEINEVTERCIQCVSLTIQVLLSYGWVQETHYILLHFRLGSISILGSCFQLDLESPLLNLKENVLGFGADLDVQPSVALRPGPHLHAASMFETYQSGFVFQGPSGCQFT